MARPRRPSESRALLFKIHLPASQIVIQTSYVQRYENNNKFNYNSILTENLRRRDLPKQFFRNFLTVNKFE